MGFYTVLLERNDEVIIGATVRVYGEKVAEVPLVATRFQYCRLGMCRILMNELGKGTVMCQKLHQNIPADVSSESTEAYQTQFDRITTRRMLSWMETMRFLRFSKLSKLRGVKLWTNDLQMHLGM